MFTRKSFFWHQKLKPLATHVSIYSGTSQTEGHTIHICAAGSLTREKKKLKKSSDWEATHDVSGRLILLRLEGRLWRWRARSFHCFSDKKPLWGATDPHPPPRWHLGTSFAHKIPPTRRCTSGFLLLLFLLLLQLVKMASSRTKSLMCWEPWATALWLYSAHSGRWKETKGFWYHDQNGGKGRLLKMERGGLDVFSEKA